MSYFVHHWLSLPVALVVMVGAATQLARGARADDAQSMEPAITDEDRQHWAFRPLASPEMPRIENSSWPQNPIDQFVLQRLRESGRQPAPPADRHTLLRRVTFDLTGLPPTPSEIRKFLADRQPGAYGRVVDRLLASPAYGERWAQHWLDLARFAETDGFEHDKVRPEAWRYRDWVIKAFNDDMPYGEFVRQQIAGDLLYPGNAAAAIATGFALCGPDMTDINLVAERRHMVLNDMTSTVGSVMLGLQFGCAECHDHKYDPISQADFYRLRAIFEPALHFAANRYEAQDESRKNRQPRQRIVGRALYEDDEGDPPDCYLWLRGDFRARGPRVEPGLPRIAVHTSAAALPLDGSRVALANWLSRPDNFLVLRVIVNRLWQHHFGHGIVRSPSDFGTMGQRPTHPELLDWLAGALHGTGGSLKEMHKLMVTSATYRQASRLEAPTEQSQAMWTRAAEIDPQNRLLWRANRQRLEGEAIRDTMLAAANRLSDRQGGVGVMPPLPEELIVTLLKNQWQVTDNQEDHRRRSIYLFVRRNLRYPLFEAFDRPDTNASCPRRSQSTIAPQALVLLNSEFSLEQARELAMHVVRQAGSNVEACVHLMYQRTLARPPNDEQLARALEFLDERAERSRRGHASDNLGAAAAQLSGVDQHELAALTLLGLAVFNLNEFVYID